MADSATGAGATAEEHQLQIEEEDDDDTKETKKYKVAPKVDIQTILSKDTGDESLERYKRSLLGIGGSASASASSSSSSSSSSTSSSTSPPTDALGRQVVVRELRILVKDRPDIIIPLATPDDVAAAATNKLIVKEGAEYIIAVNFNVYRDVVLGLKFTNIVTKMGIKVDTLKVMIGSYAPKPNTTYEYKFPVAEWPSGMLARGSYGAKTTFADDDGTTHLSFAWNFEIKKEWPSL